MGLELRMTAYKNLFFGRLKTQQQKRRGKRKLHAYRNRGRGGNTRKGASACVYMSFDSVVIGQ